jgi:D-glycero-D-manno-heptose 1,7-bisphosphate phosphatase
MTKAVFLDRDGVLNRSFVRDGKPHPPASLDQLEILPGVPEACGNLRSAGFLLILVTNQPDVARGTARREDVAEMNDVVVQRAGLDHALTCFHRDEDRCRCRKPKPGLILEAAKMFPIDLKASFMVGDRWRDIGAGQQAGCRTIFIDHHYDEPVRFTPDYVTDSLLSAAAWILGV